MKHLFDATVAQFDKKVAFERQKVAKSYETILEKQRSMILSFEMKYNNMIRCRVDTLENALADVQTDLARLSTTTGVIKQKLIMSDEQ